MAIKPSKNGAKKTRHGSVNIAMPDGSTFVGRHIDGEASLLKGAQCIQGQYGIVDMRHEAPVYLRKKTPGQFAFDTFI